MADRRIYLGNGIGSGKLEWQVAKHVSSAFTGDTDGTHGDQESGTPTPTYTIWTVTGMIAIQRIWGVCNVSLTGAAGTVEVGTADSTALFCAQVTATDFDANEMYSTAGISAIAKYLGENAANSVAVYIKSANIIETTGTANIDTGQIDYYMIWAPMEAGAIVVSSGALS
jgi:hypothetical protein